MKNFDPRGELLQCPKCHKKHYKNLSSWEKCNGRKSSVFGSSGGNGPNSKQGVVAEAASDFFAESSNDIIEGTTLESMRDEGGEFYSGEELGFDHGDYGYMEANFSGPEDNVPANWEVNLYEETGGFHKSSLDHNLIDEDGYMDDDAVELIESRLKDYIKTHRPNLDLDRVSVETGDDVNHETGIADLRFTYYQEEENNNRTVEDISEKELFDFASAVKNCTDPGSFSAPYIMRVSSDDVDEYRRNKNR